VFTQLQSKMRTLSGAAMNLLNASSFSVFKATSSTTDVATITAGTGGTPSTVDLQVFQLATSQKLASTPQGSATAAMGWTGKFTVNSKEISVGAGDTLQDIAQKLNSADAGVTASVVTGNGQSYLTLTSKTSGKSGSMSLADVSGDQVLHKLGFVTGTVGETTTNVKFGTQSVNFSSASAKLGDLLGLDGKTGVTGDIKAYQANLDAVQGNHDLYNSLSHGSTFTLTVKNGADPVDVKVSLNDNLNTIADKFNKAFGEDVVSVKTDASGSHLNFDSDRLSVGSDPLGIFKGTRETSSSTQSIVASSVLVQAQDAQYTMDGLSFTSGTNTITNAVGGATVTLLKAAADGSAKSKLEVSSDYGAVEKNLQSFADNFNGVLGYIKDASQFDAKTFASGPLFGNATANAISDELGRMIFQNIPGLTGTYKSLSSLGFGYNTDGQLSINNTTLETALKANPTAVAAVFQAVGSSSAADLKFVGSTAKTVSNGGHTPYKVNITQAATSSSLLKDINASYFGSFGGSITIKGDSIPETTITFEPGKSISDIATAINANSVLKNSLTASVDTDGRLKLVSKLYGSPSAFTATSTADSYFTNNNLTPNNTYTAGLDVLGTINGEAATGRGQTLTGATGNKNTEGLQVNYTGSALGLVGDISLTKGMAALMQERVDAMTLDAKGIFKSTQSTLQAQYDDMTASIGRLGTLNANREAALRAKFTAMEAAIQKAKDQGGQLTSMLSSLSA